MRHLTHAILALFFIGCASANEVKKSLTVGSASESREAEVSEVISPPVKNPSFRVTIPVEAHKLWRVEREIIFAPNQPRLPLRLVHKEFLCVVSFAFFTPIPGGATAIRDALMEQSRDRVTGIDARDPLGERAGFTVAASTGEEKTISGHIVVIQTIAMSQAALVILAQWPESENDHCDKKMGEFVDNLRITVNIPVSIPEAAPGSTPL